MTSEARSTWRFPKEFWAANFTELFERMAYYACLIYLVVYLTREVGFDDSQAGTIAAFFAFFTFLIAVPTGVKFFNWLATMWGGRLRLTTPMLYAMGTVATIGPVQRGPSGMRLLLNGVHRGIAMRYEEQDGDPEYRPGQSAVDPVVDDTGECHRDAPDTSSARLLEQVVRIRASRLLSHVRARAVDRQESESHECERGPEKKTS
mgnify:CR=1 FL=1